MPPPEETAVSPLSPAAAKERAMTVGTGYGKRVALKSTVKKIRENAKITF